MITTALRTALVLGSGIAALALTGTAAQAAAVPALDSDVAYARDGAIYVTNGAGETRLTDADRNSRPRWSTDGARIAYLHGGELWQMNADGADKHRVTEGAAAGASYSPDGRWIAYSAPACLGGPGVYRVRATAPHGAPEVLFPAACKDQAAPAPNAPNGPATGDLATRLSKDDAVAWSPDGTKIAFRGGDCESVFDNCLSIGNLTTGMERTLAGFGGGGSADGFATVPAFNADGTKVSWTTAAEGEKVHVTEANADGTAHRQVGSAEDRELAYVGTTGKALVAGKHDGRSWLVLVDLASGARTPFRQGSQPAVRA
jgi:TolB protein